MDWDLSLFLTIISVIGGVFSILYGLRRFIEQNRQYTKVAEKQDQKIEKMDTKLDFILSNQRSTDVILNIMMAAMDDLNEGLGKPRKFNTPEISSILAPITKDQEQRVLILKEIQDMQFNIAKWFRDQKKQPTC